MATGGTRRRRGPVTIGGAAPRRRGDRARRPDTHFKAISRERESRGWTSRAEVRPDGLPAGARSRTTLRANRVTAGRPAGSASRSPTCGEHFPDGGVARSGVGKGGNVTTRESSCLNALSEERAGGAAPLLRRAALGGRDARGAPLRERRRASLAAERCGGAWARRLVEAFARTPHRRPAEP